MSTSRLKMPTGGPSIDSNAMVGPDGSRRRERGVRCIGRRAAGGERGQQRRETQRNARDTGALRPRSHHPCTTLWRDAEVSAAVICRSLGSAKSRVQRVQWTLIGQPQRNRIDVTAVIRLGPMGGAAVAEKARRVRIGAEPKVLDALDFSTFEPRPDVAGQVEHRVAGAGGRREEAIVCGIGRLEAIDELRADLVVRLADHRPERGADAARCAPSFSIAAIVASSTPVSAPLPSGVRRADHTGLRVGEQDRPAVRRGDADRQTRHACDDRVGARGVLARPRLSATITSGEWI